MNVEEKAQEYAQNKMQQVLNDAVAEAYMEGYKQGYEDGQAKMPQEVTTGDVEYVDLGLPSGTLWAKDYVKQDGQYLFLPYPDAEKLNIPSQVQFNELKEFCKYSYFYDSQTKHFSSTVLGPNGNFITLKNLGYIMADNLKHSDFFEFWLINFDDNTSKKIMAHAGKCELSSLWFFSGCKLPVQLVKSSK